ncbi:protein AFG2 [Metschnikowia bicuspidata var. bicuspidata NRRL YB-4993]|uniref:Protein AFG2 n=1 Tax=Metschnikowia bicuspidata var. bicuspidata NRRL YB-4993 TaxID=869754 RepID=A0A1A0H7N8_9ASCO|nr:protein AFG2 [Metschnikowia bicuspidata var. bicuspidata NRRL YB-4993]OBA19907.1 protein AFG2 [Metschnikowia bicuspidata var. bicuspidata NRRL YB-4993]
MSSKAKKKTTAPNAAPAEGKKIKVPKLFITRPTLKSHTTVYLHPEIAQALELSPGQFVVVSKEGGSDVLTLVDHTDESEELNVVLVPKATRALAGLLLGDRISISRYQKQVPFAQAVRARIEGRIDEKSAKAALKKAGLLHPGLLIPCKDLTIRVVGIDLNASSASSIASVSAQMAGLSISEASKELFVSPPHLCIPNTDIGIVDYDVDPTQFPRLPRPYAFDQVGGLDKPISLLRSTVQIPLHHASLFLDFGISPPRGILLHGPPGTGKTMLLRCVAHESDAHVLMVNGPLIVSKYLGETENALRDLFAEAVRYQPAIIFMDEIDSLAPKRGLEDAGETESRVVATLLTMMDGMGDAGRVVVVGATNRPNSIDPALRRPGRFDQEVEVGIPDVEARADILRKQLAKMNQQKCQILEDDVITIASKTHGYVGADLSALCREGVMKAIARGIQGLDTGDGNSSGMANLAHIDHLDPLTKVECRDLEAALVDIRPSAMREIFLEMPKVSWSDISGQHELKQKLTEVVQLPLEAAETFLRLGISSPKGVLLYGPPGCSKTLTAKALASESGLNFLAVKGPEIFNKYVGESERTIREIFRKARAAAPSIIFFDEIDALASSREDASTLASQNVLTSLLNEIDGVEELKGVVVVAATNRPSEIDSALLRPGRLDRHIYVSPPDLEARLDLITKKCTKFDVRDSEALFTKLAQSTEGCSGAEVALLCQEAGLAAIMENKNTHNVEERHFEHALKGISRGITPEMLEYYKDFAHRSGLSM